MEATHRDAPPPEFDPQKIEFTVPSRMRTVGAAVQFVRELLMSMDLSKRTIFSITLSLEEAMTNVIRHAYKGDETKEIIVRCELDATEAVIRVRDFGRQALPSDIRPRNLDDYRRGGLGVHLMRELMDSVEYDTTFDVGSELTMVKKIQKADHYSDDALWEAVFSRSGDEDLVGPVYDQMTGLPTIRGIAAEASEMYLRDGAVGVLLFDAKRFPDREQLYPYELVAPLLSCTAKALERIRGEVLVPEDLLATNRPMYDDFVVILSAGPRGRDLGQTAMEKIARQVQSSLVAAVMESLDSRVRPLFGMRYAGAMVRGASSDPQRPLYEGIKQAGRALARRRSQAKANLFVALCQGLEAQEVRTLFQPIISTRDSSVLGYEAFSLLVKGDSDAVPQALFDAALEANLSWELDKLCIERALARSANAPAAAKLFLNVEMDSLTYPQRAAVNLIEAADVVADRIVLELHARSLPKNWDLFCEGLATLRGQGLSVCVADVNAGLTSLATVDRVSPDFVKFDSLLVRDCARDPLKLGLLRSLLERCRGLGRAAIAMGVESEDDFRVVLELGIDYAQGYYIAKPSEGFAGPDSVPTALINP